MLQCPNGGKTQPNRVKKESSLSERLHPRLRDWFFASFPAFTHAQLLCVPSVLNGESILLTSPTGSGKTLAGFLGVFDSLLRELESGSLKPGVRCVYIPPRCSRRASQSSALHADEIALSNWSFCHGRAARFARSISRRQGSPVSHRPSAH